MQVTSILMTIAVYWANQQVMTSIDQNLWDFGDYYYTFICIIKEEYSDQEKSKWQQ